MTLELSCPGVLPGDVPEFRCSVEYWIMEGTGAGGKIDIVAADSSAPISEPVPLAEVLSSVVSATETKLEKALLSNKRLRAFARARRGPPAAP